MLRRYALLFVGVFACATSVIQIKASLTPPLVLAAIRLLLAVLFLAPLFLRDLNANRLAFTRAHLRRTTLPALILALHFITWTYCARMTLASTATLIVNLVPIAIPFFLHALVGERINRREILGTTIAVGGVLLLTAPDAFGNRGNLAGDIVCVASMLFFAWYLALGRRNRDFPSLWLYIVPVYFQAGVFCLIAGLPQFRAFDYASAREWSLLLGLSLGPTIVGHSLLNHALRYFRGQIVSLCNVGQFVFATVLAWFIFHEVPAPLFYFSSCVIVAGIALVVFSAPTAPPRLR